MKISKTALVVAALLPLAAAALPANADTLTFDWTLSGPAASLGGFTHPGSGTLTVTTGANGDTITGITGTIGGDTITGLSTVSFVGPGAGPDNLLFPNSNNSPLLDTRGLGITDSAGIVYTILSPEPLGQPVTGNPYEQLVGNAAGQRTEIAGVGSFSVTPVPLPEGWGLLALGIAGLGALSLRARKSGAQSGILAA
ncbi:MAG TPA: hypothetical protein VGI23_04320 [Steroidobacteraceae bacterium]|jgi:hypothetical protein